MTGTSCYGRRGPYGTEGEVIAAIDLHSWELEDYPTRNLARLTDAAEAAGAELGSYGMRILNWLAGYEPQSVGVIAALIERAGQEPTIVTAVGPKQDRW